MGIAIWVKVFFGKYFHVSVFFYHTGFLFSSSTWKTLQFFNWWIIRVFYQVFWEVRDSSTKRTVNPSTSHVTLNQRLRTRRLELSQWSLFTDRSLSTLPSSNLYYIYLYWVVPIKQFLTKPSIDAPVKFPPLNFSRFSKSKPTYTGFVGLLQAIAPDS